MEVAVFACVYVLIHIAFGWIVALVMGASLLVLAPLTAIVAVQLKRRREAEP
jgi:hypothetical protein